MEWKPSSYLSPPHFPADPWILLKDDVTVIILLLGVSFIGREFRKEERQNKKEIKVSTDYI